MKVHLVRMSKCPLTACLLLAAFCGCEQRERANANPKPQIVVRKIQEKDRATIGSTFQDGPEWIGEPVTLFDGKSIDGWETIEFGGEGDCEIKDSAIALDAGVMMTGIYSTRENLPTTNYEISLDARKKDGTDFFCGLTFPVEESHCTLIVGGWGGTTIGLSCIDDLDASSNDTTSVMKFEKDQWYKIRIRVQPERISAWIDDKQVIDKDIAGKKISLRGDTELCKPIGICNFMTGSEYKNIKLRTFKPIVNKNNKPVPGTGEKSGDASTSDPETVDKQ